MKQILLDRAKMGRNVQGLNVTAKGAMAWARSFAPTWEMIMNYKQGKLSSKEYTKQYHFILERALKSGAVKLLYQYGQENNNKITFLCFCKDNELCHSYLLMDWLVEKWPEYWEKLEDQKILNCREK